MRYGVTEDTLYLSRSLKPVQETEQRRLNHVSLHAAGVSAPMTDEQRFSIRMNGKETFPHARGDATELIASPIEDLLDHGKFFLPVHGALTLSSAIEPGSPGAHPQPRRATCAVDPLAYSANVISNVSSGVCVCSPRTRA